MALVRPITGLTIQNFIIAGGNDPNDITDIKDVLRALVIDTQGKERRIRAIIQNIVDHFIPEYIVLLNAILFFNATSAPVTYVTFANRIVDVEANWITQYLDVTRMDNTIQSDLRNRLIRSLIDEYVQQYVDPTKDTRAPLIALLENSRLQSQPEFIQYATSASYNGAQEDLQIEITEKYRNDQPYIDLLVNGVIESTAASRFQDLNQLLEDIDGVPGTQIPGAPPGTVYANRRRLVGRDLTAADADTIHDLQRHAAYALNSVNLALVLQPPNIVHVPLLLPFLQAIRDAVTNMTAASPFPANFATIPGHYFDMLTGVDNTTMAEKAAALGNVAILNGLLAAGINDTAKPLMRVALTGGHYAIAEALWNHNPNYPDPWFPPGFIVTPALSTTSNPFQTVFNAKYAIFNPGARTGLGQTAIGRAGAAAAAALGIPTAAQPALSSAEQQARADAAIRLLTAMPDFVPNSTKDTLNLLTLSSIRDELARITDPTVWDAKMLLPLIAKKGAVADGTLLPKADLLATGLALGADPNVVDTTGSTALHYVANIPVLPRVVARTTTPRSILMLKTLLAAPTLDVNKVNANHETALYLMVSKVQPSIEHLTLLSRAPKLDFNVVDAAGNTPLTHLITQHPVGGPNPSLLDLNDVVQILLKGSDMTVKDNTGHTALWNAINTYTGDEYLSTIVVDLAKGLPDVASEVALIQLKTLPLTRAKLAGIKATVGKPVARLPAWLPDEYKAILSDDTLDADVKAPILKHILDLDAFITTGPPSLSDALMKELADSSFWWGVRSVKAYPIPVLSAIPVVGVLAKGPMFYDANQATTFDVKFQDNSQYTLRTPYKAPYRALATTIYNPNGAPTLAATATPADRTAAQANNDVLVKLVGRQYITTANQRFLKKILDELYYSQFNPSLGSDPLTALLHLRSKLDSLLKYHGLAQANAKQAILTKLGTTLTTFITNLISGVGLRFPTTVPLPMAFPPITFLGTSPHAAAFVAAAGAIGGIIPIVPGLRAGTLVPPPRGGLRALGGLGGLGRGRQPDVLQNIFTGDLVSSAILATNYPTAITLGPEDAMTYLPAPLGPITTANGFAVAKSDTFYKFLAPFGLTAVVRGQGYILRPAELFIALFHQPAVAVAAILRDRNHPFVRLLRDYCIPAAAGLATHKAMPSVVTELNRLRGKLPV
jgi:hypothetical protein